MAVFLRKNLTSLLVVLFLLAAYPSEVRTKPTSASPVQSDAASHDLEKVEPPRTNDSGFFIDLDSDAKDLPEDSKNSKPLQKKKVEGSSEKSKPSKLENASSEAEDKSKSKNRDTSVRPVKKYNKKAEDVPEDAFDYSDDHLAAGGWDVDSVLAKDDSEAPASSEEDLNKGSRDGAKDNETVPSKKSKSSKSDKSPVTTEDYSEALPTAAGQRYPHTEHPGHPTSTPRTPTSTHSSKGSASANLPRALCSFLVTVCTVLIML